ncbi:MAG: YfdX family protein [Thermodesulfobacteria bacterium]|nr:YfdX family protein [Thermodesulfobacteriota bacterium]
MFRKKILVCFLALCWTLMAVCSGGWAAEKTVEGVKRGAVAEAKKEAEEWREKISAEAAEAVSLTMQALTLLEQGKKEEALKAIQKALGKLDVALAVNKDLATVPIDVNIVVTDVVADLDFIKKNIEEVKRLLNKGYVQDARRLLSTLQSEVDIIIQELPLASYPPALRLAARYIAMDKIEEAKDVLHLALSSLVVREIVIPLPFVKAADLIAQAEETAKKDPEAAIKYLKEAEKQIKLAQLLGYAPGEKKRYREIEKVIKEAEKKLKEKEHPKEHFERLKRLIAELRARV